METRRITATELEVMRAWLAHDVAGAEILRGQVSEESAVYSSCECGCASIGFALEPGSDDYQLGVSVFDIDAGIVDSDGIVVGGMVLFTRSGRIHDVDVFSFFEEIPFPSLAQVRWHPRADNSAGT